MGFADFKREMDPPLDGIPELGWVLAPEVHGKGYSTEALRAIVAWGDKYLSRPKTACLIHPDNAVSVAIAQKLGFREAYRTTFASAPSVIFERAESRSSGVKT
jgi:RimJ/RimL family protein N-acetyltransferase